MIKDLLISFKDNIKAKSTNPFFGTLIIMWFIKNWSLIYGLLNFDEDKKYNDKVAFIIGHFDKFNFYKTLGWCIFDTFIVIIISYVLINLARLIINFFEKTITPQVYKISDQSSIVLKSEYEKLIKEKEKVEEKFENERQNRLRIQGEYEKLELKLKEQLTDTAYLGSDESESKQIAEAVSNDIDKEKAQKLYKKLIDEGKLSTFKKYVSNALNQVAMMKDEKDLSDFVTLGLFNLSSSNGYGKYYYVLTDLGRSVKDLVFAV